jgi:transposase InsO family protein
VRSANVGWLLLRSNQEWALDFACDALTTGRGIRILAVMDAFTRECLTLEVDTSLSNQRITCGLESDRAGPGADLAALFGMRGAQDLVNPHSAGTANPGRPRGEFRWETAGRVLERQLVSEPGRCQDQGF